MIPVRFLFTFLLLCTLPVSGKTPQGVNAPPNTFAVEPYLLDVTDNSAVIAFHLKQALAAKVKLFDENRISIFDSPENSLAHFVEVTGLAPGLSYRYEVICGGGIVRTPADNPGYRIRTSARPGESFSFVVYGDPRPGDNITPHYHKKVIEQIILNEPMFSLVLGDMVDHGEQMADWHEFLQIESRLLRGAAIYPVIGDNDYSKGKGHFAEFFPGLKNGFYNFEWGGVQFFALSAWDTRGSQSSAEFNAESRQMQWFQSEIAKHEVQSAPFRIVFLHDPVFISRGRSSKILRQVWAPIFKKNRVDVVFASWHLYERSINEGVTYIVTGGAGAELIWMPKDPSYPALVDAKEYHFCRVDVNANSMTIRATGMDGTVFDSIMLMPNDSSPQTINQIERNARRLSKTILINENENYPAISLQLFSYDCSYCRRLLEHDLPQIAREYEVSIKTHYYNLGDEGTYDLLLNAGVDFGRQGTDLPTIFVGKTTLGGEDEIKLRLPEEIAAFKQHPAQYQTQAIEPFSTPHATGNIREEAFDMLTFGIVVSAGLLDGINPCAFTTIIFLISYLSFVGISRKQMFITGGVFSLAVFLTYLFIGMMFYHLVKIIIINQAVARMLNIFLLLVVLALFIFSIVDYIRCLKGNLKDLTLQLPDFFKTKIRKRIRDFAQNKIAISSTSFILGVVIAGMELTCTGQVYLPIVTMIAEPEHRIAAMQYLIAYNIAFILPLVVVFLITTFGVTSDIISKFFRKHIANVKLGLALLFMTMAIIILFNLGWL